MKIIKTYYLIDYENVGSEGFKGCGKLRETDIIHLFYTDNSRKIDLDIINDHGESKLVTHKVPTGNQSADMHLGSYLGYLLGTECVVNSVLTVMRSPSSSSVYQPSKV